MKLHPVLFLALLFAMSPAFAATAFTGKSTTVTSTVPQNCTIVSGSGIAFGAYNSLTTHKTANLDAQSSFSVKCSEGLSGAVVTLSAGSAPGGSCAAGATTRRMTAGSTLLKYDLYQDGARSLPWGCAPENQLSLSTFTNSTVPVVLNFYGRVFPNQGLPVSGYSDIVTIQVIF